MSEMAGTAPKAVETDVSVREQMDSLAREAAERATFHRVELERWMRVGRAAAAAVTAIQACEPIAQTTIEDFYDAKSTAYQQPARA